MINDEVRSGTCRNGHAGHHSYRNRRGGWVCRLCKNGKTALWRRASTQKRDEAHSRRAAADLARKRASRAAALALLGGRCICCGQTRSVFLQFDHINNDGAEHRRRIGYNSGQTVWRWVLKNRAVAHLVIQILCANCNMAKAIEEDHTCPPEE